MDATFYRKNARLCLMWAKSSKNQENKKAFIDLAKAWAEVARSADEQQRHAERREARESAERALLTKH